MSPASSERYDPCGMRYIAGSAAPGARHRQGEGIWNESRLGGAEANARPFIAIRDATDTPRERHKGPLHTQKRPKLNRHRPVGLVAVKPLR